MHFLLQEEPMEGCHDGVWNGIRYFSCRQGHALFCPLSSLTPDQRFAQTTVVDVNRKCSEYSQYTNYLVCSC